MQIKSHFGIYFSEKLYSRDYRKRQILNSNDKGLPNMPQTTTI